MNYTHREERPADDLRKVADMLRDRRSTPDPLMLDRVKLRALNGARGCASSRQKGFSMRSRMAMLLAVGFLALGSGGALALTGGDFAGDSGGSASFHQYRPPCEHGKGRGEDHECHGHEGEHGHEGGGDNGRGQGGGDHGHH
jgi:hypothetical protein